MSANIPFYGFAVLCIDHPVVQGMIPRVSDRRILTYGFSPQADIRAVNVRLGGDGSRFDAVDRRPAPADAERTIPDLFLPMFGEHNVQNSLAAIAVAERAGHRRRRRARRACAISTACKRRFTKTGEWNGVAVIDDYGHHPVEIAAVLKAARAIAAGRVIAVVQPHRYTRLADLFDGFCTCFNDADIVLVADVYAAGEAPIDGRRPRRAGRRAARARPSQRATACRAAASWRRSCASWRGRATWSCASAPARSPTGPTPAATSWRGAAEPR